MSKTKHTPGPWAHESKKGPHNAEGTVSSIGVFSVAKFDELMDEEDSNESDAIDGSWVCGIWGEISVEDESNASLIAAAPELLEALILLRNTAGDLRSGFSLSVDPDRWVDQFLAVADAAIAKAEGRA